MSEEHSPLAVAAHNWSKTAVGDTALVASMAFRAGAAWKREHVVEKESDLRLPFGRFRAMWHLIHLGHSISVNRGITVPLGDATSKGWLYRCECGRVWAR